jgi:tetratricopeptide (TPR) repeat protein
MTNLFIGILLLVPISALSSLERGDQEFGRFRYALATAIYDSVLATSPDSADVLWRLARVHVCRGDISPEEQRLGLYKRAEIFASRCIRADSTRSEGHTWRAAALGNIAMFEGSKAKVELCQLIKEDLDRSISLNPEDDIAYSILGSFYRALGNVSWVERQLANLFLGSLPEGGYEESERALKKAIALSPGIIRHHSELGGLYMEQDRDHEALEEFRMVLELPVLIASDKGIQQWAAVLVNDLSAK